MQLPHPGDVVNDGASALLDASVILVDIIEMDAGFCVREAAFALFCDKKCDIIA